MFMYTLDNCRKENVTAIVFKNDFDLLAFFLMIPIQINGRVCSLLQQAKLVQTMVYTLALQVEVCPQNPSLSIPAFALTSAPCFTKVFAQFK